MDNQLKVFSLQFFKELGASVSDCGDYLDVADVPQKFQKFYGKNEPYRIVFEEILSNSETELVTSESYLLKMMKAYLDNSGDAVLLSLNYKLHVDSFIKDNFKIQNCSVVKINTNANHNFLFKFTFQTTYKYLNEEDKLISEVYVDDGVVIEPDLNKFAISNLNKKDIEITELRDYYSIAKENIKESINDRTSKVAEILESSLSKEILRINSYYEQQIKEIDEQISKVNSRSKDPVELEKQKFQFINEKDLFIQNEQKKHALRLNTKLITTTIIDYPVYSLEIFFKSGDVTRLSIVKFDPLKNKIDFPLCDLCKNSLNEIILCNGSHLVCRNCGAKCQDCNSISCELCLKNICAVTKRKICKQCGRVCARCKEFKNKRFMIEDSSGRSFVCREC